jgi:hypothetical protein
MNIDLERGLSSAWANVATFVPKLLAALLILIVGYFVAKFVAKLLDTVLERVGFDRAVERGGFKRALARSKYDPSDIVAKLAFWTTFLIVLQMAFGIFGANPVSDLLRGVIAYLPNVLVAIVILVIAGAIAKFVTELLASTLGGLSAGPLLAKGAGIAVLLFGAFAALNQLRIAPAIVNGLFYAVLAVVVGSAIVAIGGGGIPVARRYLERAAGAAEEKGGEARQQVRQQRAQETAGLDPTADLRNQRFDGAPEASRSQRR